MARSSTVLPPRPWTVQWSLWMEVQRLEIAAEENVSERPHEKTDEGGEPHNRKLPAKWGVRRAQKGSMIAGAHNCPVMSGINPGLNSLREGTLSCVRGWSLVSGARLLPSRRDPKKSESPTAAHSPTSLTCQAARVN